MTAQQPSLLSAAEMDRLEDKALLRRREQDRLRHLAQHSCANIPNANTWHRAYSIAVNAWLWRCWPRNPRRIGVASHILLSFGQPERQLTDTRPKPRLYSDETSDQIAAALGSVPLTPGLEDLPNGRKAKPSQRPAFTAAAAQKHLEALVYAGVLTTTYDRRHNLRRLTPGPVLVAEFPAQFGHRAFDSQESSASESQESSGVDSQESSASESQESHVLKRREDLEGERDPPPPGAHPLGTCKTCGHPTEIGPRGTHWETCWPCKSGQPRATPEDDLTLLQRIHGPALQ